MSQPQTPEQALDTLGDCPPGRRDEDAGEGIQCSQRMLNFSDALLSIIATVMVCMGPLLRPAPPQAPQGTAQPTSDLSSWVPHLLGQLGGPSAALESPVPPYPAQPASLASFCLSASSDPACDPHGDLPGTAVRQKCTEASGNTYRSLPDDLSHRDGGLGGTHKVVPSCWENRRHTCPAQPGLHDDHHLPALHGTDCGVCISLPAPAEPADPVLRPQGSVPTTRPGHCPPRPSPVLCSSHLLPLLCPLVLPADGDCHPPPLRQQGHRLVQRQAPGEDNVPDPKEVKERFGGSLVAALSATGPRFLAYFGSFATVGLLWFAHHSLFLHVRKATRAMGLLNTLSLAFVGGLPLAYQQTSAFARQPRDELERVRVSCAIIFLASIFQFAIWTTALLHQAETLQPSVWFGGREHALMFAKLALYPCASLLAFTSTCLLSRFSVGIFHLMQIAVPCTFLLLRLLVGLALASLRVLHGIARPEHPPPAPTCQEDPQSQLLPAPC
ncbi:endosomal/lysosomal proton channel TMEM175 isoform X4 [Macaca thibetana thibetana]|uniref:endosomal/lysosomal proton channel TMEM175 isoform X4 n=1 Tax=Macaca thibetana thibetana TaxID=257877 RepID=UPI0021BCA38D|nr:endosomal/lysosomal proton channel TMEM175 isoform X4 [Macaca thibetana thibetana]